MLLDRRFVWLLGLVALQVALLVATYPIPELGDPTWHHTASLALALVVCGVFWRPVSSSRRFLAMGVLALTVLATASGFWLLYWKEGLRLDGLQDWGRFWHVLWSWFAVVFFFQHVWINRRAFVTFFKRTLATRTGTLLHVGAYLFVLAAFLVTWTRLGSGWFTNDNYIQLSFYAWLVFAVPPYLLWGYVRSSLSFPISRDRVVRLFHRHRVQVWFSVALVPIAALALLSGVPLVFMKDLVDAGGLKYVAKYWHVWPSVLFAVLVFGHSIHSWPGVKNHWASFASGSDIMTTPHPAIENPAPMTAASSTATKASSIPPGHSRTRTARRRPARRRD